MCFRQAELIGGCNFVSKYSDFFGCILAAMYTSVRTCLQHYGVCILTWGKYQGACRVHDRTAMTGAELHRLWRLVLCISLLRAKSCSVASFRAAVFCVIPNEIALAHSYLVVFYIWVSGLLPFITMNITVISCSRESTRPPTACRTRSCSVLSIFTFRCWRWCQQKVVKICNDYKIMV